MSLAFLTTQSGDLAVIAFLGLAAGALAYRLLARTRGGSRGAAGEGIEGYGSYKLLLNTLDRSNILLWWGKVTLEGSSFNWTIKTPQNLHDNSIYKLAKERERGGLWEDSQAPDNERTKKASADALIKGLPGYRQEFRIIGDDKVHWLSEEVTIQREGPNEWTLAGVVVDVSERQEAEEAHRKSEEKITKILKGADCL